jgi:Rieske Fe-S protein
MATRSTATTRRGFLGTVTIGAGAALGGVAAVPVLAYELASSANGATFRPVSLGPVERFRSETGFQPTPAPYVEDPTQPVTSAGLAYVHHTGHEGGDWLAADAMFVVFSNRCTHVGCPVQASGVGFSCPCHGSAFDTRGARVAGPAVRPLDRFQWELRDDELWLTQLWSALVDDRGVRYFPVKAPGQPLDGEVPAADLLYPPVTYRQRHAPRSH